LAQINRDTNQNALAEGIDEASHNQCKKKEVKTYTSRIKIEHTTKIIGKLQILSATVSSYQMMASGRHTSVINKD
jgi:hypothetical protein